MAKFPYILYILYIKLYIYYVWHCRIDAGKIGFTIHREILFEILADPTIRIYDWKIFICFTVNLEWP